MRNRYNFTDFANTWLAAEKLEREGAMEQFVKLCAIMIHPTMTDIDPTNDLFAAEKEVAINISRRKGRADAWKRGFFVWEFKSEGKSPDEAYMQALQYQDGLGNPPIIVLSFMKSFAVHAKWTGYSTDVYTFSLEELRDNAPVGPKQIPAQDVMWAVFWQPELLKPDNLAMEIGEREKYEVWRNELLAGMGVSRHHFDTVLTPALDELNKLRKQLEAQVNAFDRFTLVDTKFLNRNSTPTGLPLWQFKGMPQWWHILDEQVSHRHLVDKILTLLDDVANDTGNRFQLVIAEHGTGKTSVLMQLAVMLAKQGAPVFWFANEGDELPHEAGVMLARYAMTLKSKGVDRLYLLIDNVLTIGNIRRWLQTTITEVRKQESTAQIIIIGTSRPSHQQASFWNDLRGEQPAEWPPLDGGTPNLHLSRFTADEVESLIIMLKSKGGLKVDAPIEELRDRILRHSSGIPFLMLPTLVGKESLEELVEEQLTDLNTKSPNDSKVSLVERRSWSDPLKVYHDVCLVNRVDLTLSKEWLDNLYRNEPDTLRVVYRSWLGEMLTKDSSEGLRTIHPIFADTAIRILHAEDYTAESVSHTRLGFSYEHLLAGQNEQELEDSYNRLLATAPLSANREVVNLLTNLIGSNMLPDYDKRVEFAKGLMARPETKAQLNKMIVAASPYDLAAGWFTVFYLLGNAEATMFFINHVIDKTPQDDKRTLAVAYNNRAQLYKDAGDFEKELRDYDTAVKADPQDPVARMNLAISLFSSGDKSTAFAHYAEALKHSANPVQILVNRGETYRRMRWLELALTDLNEAIVLDPEDPTGHFNRALVYADLGWLRAMLEDFDHARQLRQNNYTPIVQMGSAFNHMGLYPQAAECYNTAIAYWPDRYTAYLNRGVAYLRMGNALRAVEDLENARRLDPKKALIYSNLGLAYILLAKQYVRQRVVPTQQMYAEELSLLHMDLRQRKAAHLYQMAYKKLQAARRINPDEPYAMFGLGQIFENYADQANRQGAEYADSAIRIAYFRQANSFELAASLFFRECLKAISDDSGERLMAAFNFSLQRITKWRSILFSGGSIKVIYHPIRPRKGRVRAIQAAAFIKLHHVINEPVLYAIIQHFNPRDMLGSTSWCAALRHLAIELMLMGPPIELRLITRPEGWEKVRSILLESLIATGSKNLS